MKKVLCAMLAAVMVTMSLASCGDNGGSSSDASPSDSQSSASTPEGNNTTANPDGPIAIVVPAAEHGWMAGIAYFAEQKCKEMGLEEGTGYKLVTSANVNDQANQIEEMIDLGASAIVLLPHTDEVSVAAQKIMDAKIPLVVFDRKVTGDYTAYLAGDNPGIGTESAKLMGEKLGGEGTIAVLNVPSSGSVSTERVDAFKAEMTKSYPNIKLVDFTADDFTQQSGLKTATDVLVANEKLDAIFSIDDESSLGILQAINDAGRTDIKYLSGAGGSQTYFQKINEAEGIELFTATYSPSMIKDAIQAAKDIVDGKDVPKDNIIPPTIVTKDNVSTVLDANSPY